MIFLVRIYNSISYYIRKDLQLKYLSMMKRGRSIGMGSGDIAANDLLVLYQDDHFLAIDKPFDVRMDGDMDITVEKLLHARFGSLDDPSQATRHNESRRGYKWVHQLDYATSGTLLIALDRQAAASATKAFAERKTFKEYLAMVYDHVMIRSDFQRIDERDIDRLREHHMIDHVPKHLDADSHNEGRNWQIACRDDLMALCIDALEKIDLSSLSNDSDMDEVTKYRKISLEEYQRNFKLRKQMRKFLKKLGYLPTDVSSSIAAVNSLVDNDKSVNEPIGLIPSSSLNPQPYVFNHSWPWNKNIYVYRCSTRNRDIIWVSIPIAEVSDHFPCEFGHDANPGRYAETEIEILEYGRCQGRPVTKLRLIPHTGRRHQLRLHCLALGYHIVGDCTYAEAFYRAHEAERMMLHSLRLRIPIEGWRIRGKDRSRITDYTIDLQTKDPYDEFFISDINCSNSS